MILHFIASTCDGGLTIRAVCNIIKENHTKRHSTLQLAFYSTLKSLKDHQTDSAQVGLLEHKLDFNTFSDAQTFSSFKDKKGFAVVYPSST
jgi:hypothetical protein